MRHVPIIIMFNLHATSRRGKRGVCAMCALWFMLRTNNSYKCLMYPHSLSRRASATFLVFYSVFSLFSFINFCLFFELRQNCRKWEQQLPAFPCHRQRHNYAKFPCGNVAHLTDNFWKNFPLSATPHFSLAPSCLASYIQLAGKSSISHSNCHFHNVACTQNCRNLSPPKKKTCIQTI